MTTDEYINKRELLKYLTGLRYCDIVDSPEDVFFNPDELIFGMIRLIRDFQTVKIDKEAAR